MEGISGQFTGKKEEIEGLSEQFISKKVEIEELSEQATGKKEQIEDISGQFTGKKEEIEDLSEQFPYKKEDLIPHFWQRTGFLRKAFAIFCRFIMLCRDLFVFFGQWVVFQDGEFVVFG